MLTQRAVEGEEEVRRLAHEVAAARPVGVPDDAWAGFTQMLQKAGNATTVAYTLWNGRQSLEQWRQRQGGATGSDSLSTLCALLEEYGEKHAEHISKVGERREARLAEQRKARLAEQASKQAASKGGGAGGGGAGSRKRKQAG